MLKRNMGLLAGALLALAMVTLASPSRAEIQYPWCAIYSGGRQGGGTNCGFVTWAQCMNTISGIGGTCIANAAYPSRAEEPVRRHKRHHKHHY
jgi:hypothetical protein